MKNKILIFGIICLNILVLGAFMKVFHMPGAGTMIILGMVSFALLFLPIALVNSFKGLGKTKKPLFIVGFICVATSVLGAMCKIEHLPGSNLFLLIGIPLPFMFFLPMYLYYQKKEKINSVINFAKIILLIIFIAVVNSLLTLSVTRDVIVGYTNDLESVFISSEIETLKNKTILEDFTQSKDSILIMDITKRSDAICNAVNQIQTIVINEYSEKKKLSAKEIMNNDWEKVRSVASSSIIFGFKEKPDRILILKESIDDYCKFISNQSFINKEQIENINLLLKTSEKFGVAQDGSSVSWENWLFKGHYLITVITNLEDVKLKIRLVENEVLETLSKFE
jgi:hypothetical protein